MIKRETLQVAQLRTIRSFIPREGRMNDAQRQVLEELWPKYGLALESQNLSWPLVFGRVAPITLEIGFGDGRSLLRMAIDNPDRDFIGIEVYRTGIAKLFAGINKHNVQNIRVFCADAIEVLGNCVADSSLNCVQLFFPDPWQKTRHHKRRIVQPEFAALIAAKLVNGGFLHMATDWENYAQHMLEVMQQQPGWVNTAGEFEYVPPPAPRPLTKFEQRGQLLGHGTWDLIFRKS